MFLSVLFKIHFFFIFCNLVLSVVFGFIRYSSNEVIIIRILVFLHICLKLNEILMNDSFDQSFPNFIQTVKFFHINSSRSCDRVFSLATVRRPEKISVNYVQVSCCQSCNPDLQYLEDYVYSYLKNQSVLKYCAVIFL